MFEREGRGGREALICDNLLSGITLSGYFFIGGERERGDGVRRVGFGGILYSGANLSCERGAGLGRHFIRRAEVKMAVWAWASC